MRLCRQDKDHALKHDKFFDFCAKAEANPDLAKEAQVVSSPALPDDRLPTNQGVRNAGRDSRI